jgi:hypothetical protein
MQIHAGGVEISSSPRGPDAQLVPALQPRQLSLGELLRIPSVSADPQHGADVRRAAEWVCELVAGAGGIAAAKVGDPELGELRRRLAATRWPSPAPGPPS